MPAKKDGNVKKEPWDSSDDLARTLRLADFGHPDQVRVMAHMDIQLKTYSQAREKLSSFYNLKSHLLAAGNIDKLYINAIEPWDFEMNPNKNNINLVSIHRLFASMEYENQIVVVKITVKEMKNPNDGNRIYTIKVLDMFLDKKKRMQVPWPVVAKNAPRSASVHPHIVSMTLLNHVVKYISIEAIDFDLDKKKEDVGALTAINLK